MSFLAELKRRNVIRVGVAYLVASWLLIEASSQILDIYAAPEWISRVIVALLAIGFPVALFFAWAFEITPEGVKREAEVDRDASITHVTARKLDVITIVMVVLAVGVVITERFIAPVPLGADRGQEAVPTDGRASVAVLPFVNMSGDPENEYFSDGLTETLLHMLAQVDELRVPARTSSFAFKDTNTDIRDIAAQLNVSAVLEGSVQRAGQRVRITAQLVDARDGSHIWSQNYDRQLDDIFAIQDEIANAVARAMTASLLGDAAPDAGAGRGGPAIEALSTRSTEAYDAYLRGLAKFSERSYSALDEAARALREALVIDPGFREARLALVRVYLDMGDTGLLGGSEAAERASAAFGPLRTDGSDPVAVGSGAYIDFMDARSRRIVQKEESEATFNTIAASIARAPNEIALYDMAIGVLGNIGDRSEEQLAFLDRGLAVDPLNAGLMGTRGLVLAFALDREDEALEAFARARQIQPDDPNLYVNTALVHGQRREFAESIHWMAEAADVDRQDPEIPAFVAQTLMDMGLYEQAERWITRAEFVDPDAGASQTARLVYLYGMDRRDEALALAERILRAQVDNRRGRYEMAARIYAWEMHARGQDQAVFDLFESLAPGCTSDPAYEPQDAFQVRLINYGMILRVRSLPAAERPVWIEARSSYLDRVVPGWREDDDFAEPLYLFGVMDLDTAAAAQARELRAEFDYNAYARVYYSLPDLQPLMTHPAVAAVVQDIQAKYAEQAELYLRLAAAGEIPGA